MKIKRSLRALFGVSALALMFTASPVLAADVDVSGENNTTGADSDNDNKFDVDHDVNVKVDNDGKVKNKAYADVNTGKNDQNKNTTGGDLDTGSVDATTDWESVLNAGAALAGAGDDGLEVSADFVNDTTGADSDNDNKLDVDHDVRMRLNNLARVFNKLDLDANTGKNDQNKNTTAGDLTTGDIGVDAMIANWANNDSGFAGANATEVSVDVLAENHKTGYKSDNNNKVKVDNDYNLRVNNNARIKNIVDVYANTGKNDQNKNTTAGDLTTGGVAVATDIVNSANNGSGASAGGNLSVGAVLSNDTTGANSDNKNQVKVDNDVKVTVNNDAKVENKLDVNANTGKNDQNKNTEGGDVSTGDVSVDFTVTNEVNSN